jgi:ankyrin repeat protein
LLLALNNFIAGLGNVEIVEVLLKNKANINFPNSKRQGITPLHIAAASGYNITKL